ncbi:hypothetical protein CICLE_v10006982mg, partial [Citrus x clementina]
MELKAATFLLDDILYDILLKLPTKSLFRFRFVSRNWGNIIDSLSFCTKHVTTEATAAEEPQILRVPFPLGLSKALHSLSYDGKVYIEKWCWFQHMHGVGDAFLCNPLRGEVLELPRARIPTPNMSNVDHSRQHVQDCPCGSKVYTLGTDSWREISSAVTHNHLGHDGVSAYGDMHWLANSFWRSPGE